MRDAVRRRVCRPQGELDPCNRRQTERRVKPNRRTQFHLSQPITDYLRSVCLPQPLLKVENPAFPRGSGQLAYGMFLLAFGSEMQIYGSRPGKRGASERFSGQWVEIFGEDRTLDPAQAVPQT